MRFTKMHGTGNDYIYINGFETKVENPAELAIKMSRSHFGIGSDGLILIHPAEGADARMEMYNADGSRAEMCGNGIRCVAKYLYDNGIRRNNPLRIQTDAGIKTLDLFLDQGHVAQVQVNMGIPELKTEKIPAKFQPSQTVLAPFGILDQEFRVTLVNMGNPHCVIFIEDPLEQLDLFRYGPVIENHPNFPNRTNVEFVNVVNRQKVIQRTWERGSGETLACGTGACAVCVAGQLIGQTDSRITVQLKGGTLELEWRNRQQVLMTGNAVKIFEGDWPEG